MKKILLLTALCAAVITFTGCAAMKSVNDNTPHTTLTGKIAGQPFLIENPKDTALENLTVEATTNGTARIHIDKLTMPRIPRWSPPPASRARNWWKPGPMRLSAA